MSDSKTIEEDTRKILSSKYNVVKTTSIPQSVDVAYWSEVKRFKASVLAIDIRNSSSYLLEDGDMNSGKMHKAFLRVCSATINNFDGDIRTFNGDGLLAFWPGDYKSQLTQVVRAAMGITWMLTIQMKDQFVDRYGLDFGIGLSWGEVSCFRVGIEKVQDANDLIFVDKSINQAVVISKQAKSPNHIECTTNFYENLEKAAILGAKGENMWRDGAVKWKHGDFKSYLSSYHWVF